MCTVTPPQDQTQEPPSWLKEAPNLALAEKKSLLELDCSQQDGGLRWLKMGEEVEVGVVGQGG